MDGLTISAIVVAVLIPNCRFVNNVGSPRLVTGSDFLGRESASDPHAEYSTGLSLEVIARRVELGYDSIATIDRSARSKAPHTNSTVPLQLPMGYHAQREETGWHGEQS